MTILVDMDDTIEDLLGAWTAYLAETTGVCVKPEDIREWDMSKAYPSLTPEQIYSPLSNPEFWRSVRPIDSAAEYLQRLRSDGHNVYIVTASYYKTVPLKIENVLHKYFPFISDRAVIVASTKKMIKGDVLIDDNPGNLVGGDYARILFDAPHNRDFHEECYGMKRARSWEEVYAIIGKME